MAKSRKSKAAAKTRSQTKRTASKSGSVKRPKKSVAARNPTRSARRRTPASTASDAGVENGQGSASPSPIDPEVSPGVAPRFETPTPSTPEGWLEFLDEAIGELVWLNQLDRIDASVWNECCDRIDLVCAAMDPSIVSMLPEEAAIWKRPSSARADQRGLSDALALFVKISTAPPDPEPQSAPSEGSDCAVVDPPVVSPPPEEAADGTTPSPAGAVPDELPVDTPPPVEAATDLPTREPGSESVEGSRCYGVQHVPLVALSKDDRRLAVLVPSLASIVSRARWSRPLVSTDLDRLRWLADELRQLHERRHPKANAAADCQADPPAPVQSSPSLADPDWLELRAIPKSMRRRVEDLSRKRPDRSEPKIPSSRLNGFRCVHVPSLVRALRPELSKIIEDDPTALPRHVQALL